MRQAAPTGPAGGRLYGGMVHLSAYLDPEERLALIREAERLKAAGRVASASSVLRRLIRQALMSRS